MIRFEKALGALGSPGFADILKQEIEQLDGGQLPLQQGLSTGNYVADTHFTAMINNVTESEKTIQIRAGIFYQSVIGGYSCASDPTPISENAEYCEVRLDIDKASAAATITLVTEPTDT